MISDDELILYYYRDGLDAARMDAQVGQGISPRFAKASNNARLQNAVVVP